MHLLIVTFQLNELSSEAYTAHCAQIAPVFADLPGLIAKYWLANPVTNTYGGVYLWQDQTAMERYRTSDRYQRIAANPHFINVTMQDFAELRGYVPPIEIESAGPLDRLVEIQE